MRFAQNHNIYTHLGYRNDLVGMHSSSCCRASVAANCSPSNGHSCPYAVSTRNGYATGRSRQDGGGCGSRAIFYMGGVQQQRLPIRTYQRDQARWGCEVNVRICLICTCSLSGWRGSVRFTCTRRCLSNYLRSEHLHLREGITVFLAASRSCIAFTPTPQSISFHFPPDNTLFFSKTATWINAISIALSTMLFSSLGQTRL